MSRKKEKVSFGVELRRLRLASGLSQADLAGRAGISTSLVALMELNKRAPRRDKVMALGMALGLSSKDFTSFLNVAGLASSGHGSLKHQAPLIRIVEELRNDTRLSAKDRVTVETLLEVFSRWLRDQIAQKKLKIKP